MKPKINENDIIVVRKLKNNEYPNSLINKIIFFRANKDKPNIISHRVIRLNKENNTLQTSGDNNKGIIYDWEKEIRQEQIIGKYWFKIVLWQRLVFLLTYIIYILFFLWDETIKKNKNKEIH